jgi:hypothetical protein
LKTDEIGLGRLSKLAGTALPAFLKRIVQLETYGGLKTRELALAGFQKLSEQLQEICCPIGANDLKSPVLKSFKQIQ